MVLPIAHRYIPPARAGDVVGRSSDLAFKRFATSSRKCSDICRDPHASQRREPSEIRTPFPCSHPVKSDQRQRYDLSEVEAQV